MELRVELPVTVTSLPVLCLDQGSEVTVGLLCFPASLCGLRWFAGPLVCVPVIVGPWSVRKTGWRMLRSWWY